MKKIVSLVIVITMMLCMFPVSSMTASATTTGLVDLSDETKYPDGGTYTDPETNIEYTVVRSKTSFVNIKNNLSGNYILAKDISMEETSYSNCILGNSNPFSGILDGNGFSIYNFSTTHTSTNKAAAGLLAYALKEGSTVKNLSIGKPGVENYITYDPKTRYPIGGLAGTIVLDDSAETTVTISNVHIYCNIQPSGTVTSGVGIGGLLGQTAGDDTSGCSVLISDCSFTGNISFTTEKSGQNTYAGGMVGFHRGIGALDIQRCSANANIDLTNRPSGSSNNAYAGGIVGLAKASATIKDCENSGSLFADKYSGGIIGSAQTEVSFTNCVNFGNVTSSRYAGGIVGGLNFNSANTYEFNFEKCINHGDIVSNSGETSSQKYAAGGIIGLANFGVYSLNNCGNTGNIFASNTKSSGELRAAGMIGNSYTTAESATISNCFSTGTISSSLENDTRELTAVAICSGSAAGTNFVLTNCVWNMTFNDAKIESAASGKVTVDATNTAKNILAKETANDFEACVQKSNDNTKIRVLLLSNSTTLSANTDVVVKVWCGNSGKQFTIPASKIFALESVDAAGETYYGVGGAYIFGAVVTGIPTDVMDTVTDVTVVYGDYSADFTMTK